MEVVFFLVPFHVSLTSPQVVLVRPYKIWGLVLVLFWQMRKLQSHPTACSITPFSLFADTHTCTIYCPLTRMGLKRTRQCRSITQSIFSYLSHWWSFSFKPQSCTLPINVISQFQIHIAFVPHVISITSWVKHVMISSPLGTTLCTLPP